MLTMFPLSKLLFVAVVAVSSPSTFPPPPDEPVAPAGASSGAPSSPGSAANAAEAAPSSPGSTPSAAEANRRTSAASSGILSVLQEAPPPQPFLEGAEDSRAGNALTALGTTTPANDLHDILSFASSRSR